MSMFQTLYQTSSSTTIALECFVLADGITRLLQNVAIFQNTQQNVMLPCVALLR
jgi:hypothetical protein